MESPTTPTDSQESPSTMFFCRICQSVYRQPKILPCLHSFCRPCLVETVTHGKEGTVIVCPVCSHRASLPPTGVVGIPDNGFLNRMCQEYVSEIQSNLVAKSVTSEASTGSPASKYTVIRPKAAVSDSRSSSATDTTLAHQETTPEIRPVDRGPASGQSTAKAIEAIRNMSRLQTKVLSLQGEALRVTYAIDHVNQGMLEWHQHKEDVKRAIQRRSSQFQYFIKRMEHQLISQIDGKQVDDDFYAESDKSKAELRLILKNILHEVSVLKTVQEFGKDEEINALSIHLLGKSVGMTDVSMKKNHFDLETPDKSIEETIAERFGSVRVSSRDCSVFTPKIHDYTELPAANVTETSAEFGLNTSFDEGRETPIPEEGELNQAVTNVTQKRSSDRKSRRHKTDLGLGREDVQEYLAQFQSARESFKTRRKEILAQGHAREDSSPLRTEISRRPRSSSRKGRVQSVDRATLPVATRGRSSKPEVAGILSTTEIQPALMSGNTVEAAIKPPSELPLTHQHSAAARHQVPQTTDVPSSGTDHVPRATSFRGRLVKQTSDPRYTHDMPPSPEEEPSPAAQRPSLMEQLRSRRFSNPTTSFPFEKMSLDMLGQDRVSTRPLRRALSSAADKRAKMEFLKETWQKRKEILIQNQGFVSPPDSNFSQNVGRPSSLKSPPTSPTMAHTYPAMSSSGIVPSDVAATRSLVTPPLASPDDPSKDRLQQIKSRLDHYKSELTKSNGFDSGKDEIEIRDLEHIPEEPPSPKHQPQRDISTVSVTSADTVVDKQEVISIPSNVTPANTIVDTRGTFSLASSETPATTVKEEHAVISTPLKVTPTNTVVEEQKVIPQPVKTEAPVTTPEPVTITTSAPAATVISTRYSRLLPTSATTQSQVTQPATSSRYNTTTTTSRYSRAYIKPADTFDVASLIAAMYSGNEKSIIKSTQASTTAANSPTTTTTAAQQTSPRNILSTASITKTPSESTETTATTTTNTTTTTSATTRLASSIPYRYRYPSRYTSDVTTNQMTATTDATTNQTTARSTDSQSVDSKLAQTATTTHTVLSNGSQTAEPENSKTALTNVQTEISHNSEPAQSLNSQTTQLNGSQTTQSNTEVTADPSPPEPPRRSRYGLKARDARRRHTTEVGKDTIQAALRMISEKDAASTEAPSSQMPTDSTTAVDAPSIQQPSLTAAYRSRFPYLSRPLGSSNLEDNTKPSIPPLPESEDLIEDSTISFKITAQGVTTRTIPSPLSLEPRLESPPPAQFQTLHPQASAASPRSPIPSPTLPSASAMALKGKLRELARKKKERWRHLTIH